MVRIMQIFHKKEAANSNSQKGGLASNVNSRGQMSGSPPISEFAC